MIHKHILPAILGAVCFFIVWGAMGYILPHIDLSLEIKGILKIAASSIAFIVVNNYLSKRAKAKLAS